MDESNSTTTPTKSSLPIGMIAVALIVLVGVGAIGYKLMAPQSDTADSANIELTENITTPEDDAMSDTEYADGSYEAIGTYTSPAGAEEIDVKLTLADNVVTDATVTPKATNPKSKFMQDAFAGGYKEMVVGKKLSDIKLDKVSGSSLTPMGFNTAVEMIKAKAAQGAS